MDFSIFCDDCQTHLCHHSIFTPGMDSSRTVNAMTLMHSMLSTTLRHLERSASLAEKVMLMEALTCIASLTLDENDDSDDPFSLMWEAIIQTFNHLEALLELRTTTRSRMEMSSEVASSDLSMQALVQEQIDQMTQRWLRLSQSTTSRRFGTLAERWLRAYSCDVIRPLSRMLSGDSLREFNNTAIHANWCSEQREYMIWLRGERQTYATLMVPAAEGEFMLIEGEVGRYPSGGPPGPSGGGAASLDLTPLGLRGFILSALPCGA